MRNILLLVVAFVAAFAAAFVYHKSIKTAQRPKVVKVLRLSTDKPLNPGESVTDDKRLISTPLPREFESSYEGFFKDTLEDRHFLRNIKAVEHVPAGSFLLYRNFASEPASRFDALIGKDKRAYTLSVSSTKSVGFFIGPGSWIDIIGVISGDARDPASKPEVKFILSGVKVIAIDRHTTVQAFRSSASGRYGTITIELTPCQLKDYLLSTTRLHGDITVALRNSADVPEPQPACTLR